MSYNDPRPPIGYFISFRTYGTWLHGDRRGSFDRRNNVYGESAIPSNPQWRGFESCSMRYPPVKLDAPRREATRSAIEETCLIRGWTLHALNVRTNHAHTVVTAPIRAELALNAFKANATRVMRLTGCWARSGSPWSNGGSTRYLFTEWEMGRAICYVEHGQGPALD